MGFDVNSKILIQIETLAKKYAIEKIVLFGSRARGDNNLKSDIDLAIYTLPEFAQRGRFSSDIDDLDTLLNIDVIFIDNNTDKKLIENIEREGVTIYEQLQTKI